MSVTSVNRLRTALAYAESCAICQFPCAAVRNVRDTMRTIVSTQISMESPLFIGTYTCATVGAVVGGFASITVNHILNNTNLISTALSGLSSSLLTGLIFGTCANRCLKKWNNHITSPDPKTENEEILLERTENAVDETIIETENQIAS